jgi:hypothetical protein
MTSTPDELSVVDIFINPPPPMFIKNPRSKPNKQGEEGNRAISYVA